MTSPGNLPKGVMRWEDGLKVDPLNRTAFASMQEDADGEFIRLSDLPKVEDAIEERVREKLGSELAASAYIAALKQQGHVVHHSPEDTALAMQAAFDVTLKPNGDE